jgi:hypothetical protein
VSKSASEADLKKAYRKLALQVSRNIEEIYYSSVVLLRSSSIQTSAKHRALLMLSKVDPLLFFSSSIMIVFIDLAIGKAFSILNDPKKREQYDQYGHAMEPQYHRGGGGGGGGYASQHYYDDDDDFSAEEIFNLFFGYSGMF